MDPPPWQEVGALAPACLCRRHLRRDPFRLESEGLYGRSGLLCRGRRNAARIPHYLERAEEARNRRADPRQRQPSAVSRPASEARLQLRRWEMRKFMTAALIAFNIGGFAATVSAQETTGHLAGATRTPLTKTSLGQS